MITETSRKPILALIASLLIPGLGQIYNGQLSKGLIIFLAVCVLAPFSPLPDWIALNSRHHLILIVILLFAGIAFAIYIYAVRDAYRTARKIGASYTLKGMNRPYAYISVFIVGYAVYLSLFHYTHEYLLQSVYVPSSSMLPNVMPGDFLFVDKRVNCPSCKTRLHHGQLAIFYYPKDRRKLYLKRVIGMPGDNIDIKGKNVFVNGVPIRRIEVTQFRHKQLDKLLETHKAWREKDAQAMYTVIWKKGDNPKADMVTVPKGQIFVLGDNRSAADDSRRFGTVPLRDVIGVVTLTWFSYSKTSGIRWWRIGHPVEALPD